MCLKSGIKFLDINTMEVDGRVFQHEIEKLQIFLLLLEGNLELINIRTCKRNVKLTYMLKV